MALRLRIVLQDPVSDVWAAVQRGKGSDAEVVDLRRGLQPGRDEFVVDVATKDGRPSGPFIQKDAKGWFVYLVWGASVGQPDTDLSGRTKVYLPPLEQFPAGERWVVVIPGRSRNGQPAYASVVPLEAWRADDH